MCMVRLDYDGNGTATLWIQRPLFLIVTSAGGGWKLREGVGEFMRRRLIIAVVSSAVAVAGFGLGGATPASATCGLPDVCSGTSAVSATLANVLGTRSVATVAPITMTNASQVTTLSTTWDTTVAEVSRSGTNPWSIQATLSSGHVSYLTNNIPASAFVLSGNAA